MGEPIVPEAMTAVRVHALGEPPVLDRVPVPRPGEEEVLVELAASAVGHHDCSVARGELPLSPELPYTPGLEGAGLVVELGPGVDAGRLRQGTPVRVFGGGLGTARPGTWAEYAVVPARAATPIPAAYDAARAAAGGSVAAAAWAATVDVGRLGAGERLGVTGATGAVGSLCLQLAAREQVGSAVAWVRSAERAALLPESVEAALPGDRVEPVDLLVDTVGGPALAERLRDVRPGGRAVLVGYTAGTETCLSLPLFLAGDVSLLPLNMMRRRLPRGLEAKLVRDVAEGRLTVRVETIQPSAIGEAMGRLGRGATSGRVVIDW